MLWCGVSYSQQTIEPAGELERGIALFEHGDTAGAVQTLESYVKKQKNDIAAWHYLGLSFGQLGNINDARKAHEKAARNGFQLVKNLLKGETSPTELRRRFVPFIRDFTVAADSAGKYLELSPKLSDSKLSEWRKLGEHLRGYAEFSKELKDYRIYAPTEVTTKARILSKPSPMYTEDARRNQVTGMVALLLVFSADGSVRGFIPIKTLSMGLTETCIEAARRIRFTPAMINGTPVSQFIRVEYNFNIY